MNFPIVTLRLPDDLNAALKRAARQDMRSITAQAAIYIRRGLEADGFWTASGEGSVPILPMEEVAVVAPSAASPLPIAAHVQGMPREAQAKVIAHAIKGELRKEGVPLTGINLRNLTDFLGRTFCDVYDLAGVRALGADAWIQVQAGPGLVELLFGSTAGGLARNAQKERYKEKARFHGPINEAIREMGIKAKGADNLRRAWERHFPEAKTTADLVAAGPQACLDAGLSAMTIGMLFPGDEFAWAVAEAKKLAREPGGRRRVADDDDDVLD